MENYPSSTSQSDILWDLFCEEQEKEHQNQMQTAKALMSPDDDDDDEGNDSLANGLAW